MDNIIFEERIIKKWKPILDSINVDEEYYYRLALYCESFKEKDNLVMSLKLLSGLDFSKVMLIHNEKGCERFNCVVTLSQDQIFEMKMHLGIDVIAMIESSIISELRQILNKMIDEVGGVIFYKYCGTINTIEEDKRITGNMLCYSFPVERINKIKKLKSIMKLNE